MRAAGAEHCFQGSRKAAQVGNCHTGSLPPAATLPGNPRLQEEPFPASAGEECPHLPMAGRRGGRGDHREQRQWGEAAASSQAERDKGRSPQPHASPRSLTGIDWSKGPFVSVFGDVFELWGKASGCHSTQLASTVNSILVFPCTVHIVFINWERKSHLSLPRSSLTFKL